MWQWINGKKSLIGGTLMFLAGMVELIFIQKYHIQPQWLLIAVDVCKYIGDGLFAFGMGHKVVKKTMLGA